MAPGQGCHRDPLWGLAAIEGGLPGIPLGKEASVFSLIMMNCVWVKKEAQFVGTTLRRIIDP